MAQGSAATNLRIDGARLWRSLMDMAEIGPGVAGGNNRQALTDADSEARSLFQKWCEDANLTIGVDRMGTMFATRAGSDSDALPVYVGSHLDTQPTGGKFDGVLGVLAALELVRTLNDAGISTRHPIVITNFTNEEGTRFAPATLASGVFAKVFKEEWAHNVKDKDGISVGEELRRLGWLGKEEVGARKMLAYFELHIEQGPILEQERKTIGVVTHGQGLKWLRVTLAGRDSHTGTTPMNMRRNAGLGMAKIITLLEDVAKKFSPGALAGVGQCEFFPNSVNVVPGKVVFTVDIRHREQAILNQMEQEVRNIVVATSTALGLENAIEILGSFETTTFDANCVATVRRAADRLGYDYIDIVSGAIHDACLINRVAPAAMIMCPCVDGLSHNEAEAITEEWASAGANTLAQAVLETAIPVWTA